ncbi:30S ribosomal protein S7 [Candidatus Giovannonibacteria bacterium RIFCSPHIGHO2_02_43_13]|uniref:Small ribosomal subunit protein uS7 n=1 Tax=Candidatus Giovannonibacteria bacterium RIFCSPHIGHO2_02_43_13 TaxID=1798330 RepID=A0A1F5WUN4_9BACT|nr:MAG: 30S ribosomal protein S7 [Candidatus Giovannonibacteria bacterium RIFCSPHIGHO2_12_FULL_44_42]OGF79367.1 MAG: 30S ribosomal protein S7 [Candidatus Giovannonibacteria bacterium RIFCSPHIGHO2_02_43_13]OGF89932.1 MAG: 30S ribosomal protein S7 [Candidatus Giovannonibacteria bacterium RIFCSPLOWO2_02_FULL_43_54]OGF97334.1 MAG: 30S ribosomal protein S7 [Candidatus Giovannonibacteria bacterium RIFCSPLOWO2_12_FULL_44_32]
MRRKKRENREIVPDPIYDSIILSKFVNHLMLSGEKAVARRVIWGALDELKKSKVQNAENPVAVLEAALKNVAPLVEIRPRRVGGATYQVPREVSPERRNALAIRWLIAAARAKKGKPMSKKLAEEILLAIKNEGSAIKKKLDTHRMAEANRAFAHFAW